jgi:hypothetical protein
VSSSRPRLLSIYAVEDGRPLLVPQKSVEFIQIPLALQRRTAWNRKVHPTSEKEARKSRVAEVRSNANGRNP